MSSILRALKKLEQDTATGRAAVPEIPVSSDSGRMRKIVFYGFIGVVAIVAAGVLFSITGVMRPAVTGNADRIQKQAVPVGVASTPVDLPASKPVVPLKNATPAVRTARPSVKPVHRDIPRKPENTAGAFTHDAPATHPASPPKMPAADLKPMEHSQGPDTSDMGRNSIHKPSGEVSGGGTRQNRVESTPVGSSKKEKTGPEPDEIEASAGLQLQAISWSPTPERRMAVINGRIRHEGDRIEGYLITGITADYILLKTGGTIGKLTFKLR